MDNNIGQYIGQTNIQIKDKGQTDINGSLNKNLGNFENKEYLKLVLLKTEKISSALYLVSDLFSDNEPLKWTLRKNSTDIITDISTAESLSRTEGQSFTMEKISSKIVGIVSLLQVAWMGGLISKMNFEILKNEYIKLKDILEKKFRAISISELVIPSDFFGGEMMREVEERAERITREEKFFEEKNQIEKINNELAGKSFSTFGTNAQGNFYNGHIKDKQDFIADLNKKTYSFESPKDYSSKTLIGGVSPEILDKNKNKRHQVILSSLRREISYSVPEILKIIGMGTELSEKTIQRDLIHLVSSGLLKKTGERRWSRYQLS